MKRTLLRYHLFLQVLLIAVIVFRISFIILQHPSLFAPTYWQRYPMLKKEYYDSQYATKHPTHGWISDALAYTYAGGALITGTNPILIIPDAPPLGKYLIGLSAVIFDNEHVVSLLFAIASVILLYVVSQQIFYNKTLSLIAPAFWVFEPLFADQIINGPLFDIFQLVFLLCIIYFFNTALKEKSCKEIFSFFLAFCFLGFFIATKYFISGITILAAGGTVLLLKKSYRKLLLFFSSIPIAVIILLGSYLRVFAFGYSVKAFLGIQKWIFLYHKSQFILPFSVWPLILFDKWYVWFGKVPVIADTNWLITWPIITVLSFVTIILYLLKKIKRVPSLEILLSWIFFFFLFFSSGEIFSRYLIVVIPIMYIIALFAINESFCFIRKMYAHRN